MILPTKRSSLPLIAAGFLALVAAAAFVILDLGGGSLTPSELPMIQIGRLTEETGDDQASPSSGSPQTSQNGQSGMGATTTEAGGGAPEGGTTSATGTTTTTVRPAGGSGSQSDPSSTAVSPSSSTSPGDTTTQSTHRQTVTTGVREYEGHGPGHGSGNSSSTSTTGHDG